MKTLLLSIMVLFAATVQGQILTDIGVVQNIVYPISIDGERVLAGLNDNTYQVYNIETFKLEWSVAVKQLDGYTLMSVNYASRHTLDEDYTIEYFATYINSSGSYVTYLYGQDYDQKFDDVYGLTLYVVNGVYRINMYATTGYTFFYELEGNPPSPVQETENQTTISAYPNPAQSFLTINYDIKNQNTAQCMIYNASGQLVEHFVVGNAFKHVRLDVASYKPGTYIYSINGVSNRFVVE